MFGRGEGGGWIVLSRAACRGWNRLRMPPEYQDVWLSYPLVNRVYFSTKNTRVKFRNVFFVFFPRP